MTAVVAAGGDGAPVAADQNPDPLDLNTLLDSVGRASRTIFHHIQSAKAKTSQRAVTQAPADAVIEKEASAVVGFDAYFLAPPSLPPLTPSPLLPPLLAALAATAPGVSFPARLIAAAVGNLEREAQIAAPADKVLAAVQSCRSLLGAAIRANAASVDVAKRVDFSTVRSSLQRIKQRLRLQSEEDAIRVEEDELLSLTHTIATTRTEADGGSGDASDEVIHLASAGTTSCFVIEVKLSRTSHTHVVHSVHAEFLQGDTEYHSDDIDKQITDTVNSGNFAQLERQLTNVLSMESVSDRYPDLALHSHHPQVAAVLARLVDGNSLYLHWRPTLDGVQLFYQHMHVNDSGSLNPVRLFCSPPATRVTVALHPGIAFTHSLRYIGMEELIQPETPAAAAAPSFLLLFALEPPVWIPLGLAQQIITKTGRTHSGTATAQPEPQPSLHVRLTNDASFQSELHVFDSVHRYRLNAASDIARSTGFMASFVSLANVDQLVDLIRVLRNQAIFNQLYASCFLQSTLTVLPGTHMHPDKKTTMDVEVQYDAPNVLTLHVEKSLTIHIRVGATPTDPPPPPCTLIETNTVTPSTRAYDCHQFSVAIERANFTHPTAIMSDALAGRVLSLTQSIPALVFAIVNSTKRA